MRSQRELVAVAVPLAVAVVTLGFYARHRRRRRRRERHGERSGYAALIGNTPMVELRSLSQLCGRRILAKAEFLNPGGTGKDRIARAMIEEAERTGRLRPGGTVIEGTSGSTGIALAALCAAKGYRCVIVMPDDQAEEKRRLLERFGAEVKQVRTAAIANPSHYVNTARRLAQEIPGAVFTDQFETSANFQAHHEETAVEIWAQTDGGSLAAFVMSAGTGGTIAGVSQFLKARRPAIQVVLADPPGSSLFNWVQHGVCYAEQQAERRVRRHRYDTIAEGIGLDRITANLARASIDRAVRVTDQEAVHMAHFLLAHEGLFVGSSSAMNVVACLRHALSLPEGSTLVTVLCDSGQRHVTRFWNEDFIHDAGLQWPKDPDEASRVVQAMAR